MKDSRIGKRVELAPHMSRWMMGDRYGEVTGVGSMRSNMGHTLVCRVLLDKSGKTIKVRPSDLTFID